jgi:formylglycine-generating enzyme required for sulfatase activity
MKAIKPKNLCLSILICAFVINAMVISLVHAAQTISGAKRLQSGIADYDNGKYDDAVFNFEMALDLIPEEEKESLWNAHYYLGLSYYLTGDNKEMKKEFSKAYEIFEGTVPDPDAYSPKIVRLFKDVMKHAGPDIEIVFVKGGCFKMGNTFGGLFSKEGQKDERPLHEVCIDDFYIGKYEVTQGQWEEVMGYNPARFKNGSDNPVERVSWDDVQEFINKLNQKTGENYRLPTEAEWECAARSGGKRERFAGTSKESELGHYAWYHDNADYRTHPVGKKKPNGLGICDMTGNVWEWCQDWYDSDYYDNSAENNPIGPSGGSRRVFRGGSWLNFPEVLRVSFRDNYTPNYRRYYLGFRLAREPHKAGSVQGVLKGKQAQTAQPKTAQPKTVQPKKEKKNTVKNLFKGLFK